MHYTEIPDYLPAVLPQSGSSNALLVVHFSLIIAAEHKVGLSESDSWYCSHMFSSELDPHMLGSAGSIIQIRHWSYDLACVLVRLSLKDLFWVSSWFALIWLAARQVTRYCSILFNQEMGRFSLSAVYISTRFSHNLGYSGPFSKLSLSWLVVIDNLQTNPRSTLSCSLSSFLKTQSTSYLEPRCHHGLKGLVPWVW